MHLQLLCWKMLWVICLARMLMHPIVAKLELRLLLAPKLMAGAGSCRLARLMKPVRQKLTRQTRRAKLGMTLIEVLVALLISSLAIAGIVSGYIFANVSAQKFGLSLAATTQASQWMEQMRSAKWDTSSYPVIDQLTVTNFSNEVVVLQKSGPGVVVVYGTNYAQITTVSSNPPLRRIRVDCVWSFQGSAPLTNTIETFRAPDQ